GRFDEQARQSTEAMERQLTALEQRAGAKSSEVTAALDGFIDRLDDQTRHSTEAMERQLTSFEQRAAAKTGEVTTALNGLFVRLEDHTRDSTETMERQLSSFEQRATTKASEVTGALDGLITRIDGTLEKPGGVFTDGLTARTIEVARAIAESGRSASARLEATMADAGNVIADKAAFLSDRAEEINRLFGQRSTELAGTLDTGVAR